MSALAISGRHRCGAVRVLALVAAGHRLDAAVDVVAPPYRHHSGYLVPPIFHRRLIRALAWAALALSVRSRAAALTAHARDATAWLRAGWLPGGFRDG